MLLLILAVVNSMMTLLQVSFDRGLCTQMYYFGFILTPKTNQLTMLIDIDEFLVEARIEKSELDSYPITAVLDDGVGAYVWGPKQELVISRIIEAFRHGRMGIP